MTRILAACTLAAGAVFATGGTASAAPGQAVQSHCDAKISSNYVTGSVNCSGVTAYRAVVECSDGSTHYGVWTSSGWSSASCVFPQGVTTLWAQYY